MTRQTIPPHGRAHDELLQEMASFRAHDASYKDGRTWSLVYYAGEEHEELLRQATGLYIAENGLNPMAFQSVRRMESEVVQMSLALMNGPEGGVGTMTSGGTESIFLSVKAARDRARAKKPWIRSPEIVIPETAHVAFDKACHLLDIKVRLAPVGKDKRVDVAAMKRRINRNTVLIVGSAPQYPHGVIDPIEELGKLAEKKGVPLHVDACVGGFILPWLERLGRPIPRWDFRVPGVTSISADIHKYGYASKGASVVLYRSMDLMKHQFFVTTRWCGGIYASPTFAGTRPGLCIAAAYATLQGMGEDGYLSLARQALQATDELAQGLKAIPGIALVAEPEATIVTWRSVDKEVDTFVLADLLAEKGWNVDRQQDPPCIHCTVNAANLPVIGRYLQDIREAVEHARKHPELAKEGNAAMYGLVAKVPLKGLVDKNVLQAMEQMYTPGASGDPELDQELPEPVLKLLDKVDEVRTRVKDWRAR